MTTVIKGGTIVTADLTYVADVRVEGGVITEIGPDLSGGEVLDAGVLRADHALVERYVGV